MKDFMLIGNMNALTYKEFFPLVVDNKARPGYLFNKKMYFIINNNATEYTRIEDGKKIAAVNSCAWYTTLPVKRERQLILTRTYNAEDYPVYDNYPAINVDKVNEIPYDYDGTIGCPISVLEYDLDNVKIVGKLVNGLGAEYYDFAVPTIRGGARKTYARILIKLIK